MGRGILLPFSFAITVSLYFKLRHLTYHISKTMEYPNYNAMHYV